MAFVTLTTQPVEIDVDHRRGQEGEELAGDEPADDRHAERLAQFRAFAEAAGLGALPLAIGFGEGSELRQPLGVAIIGGLIASQLLTLMTTPVVYIYLARLRRSRDERFLSRGGGSPAPDVEGEAQPA